MLRIRVPDPAHALSLLEHLRAIGCIAYSSDDGFVHALLPDVSWREERPRILDEVERWRASRPDIQVEVDDA